MASIYKKGRDKAKKRSVWYITYTDENGKRKSVKGFRDKGQTEMFAAELEKEVMLRKRGLIDAQQERIAEQQRRPIEEHLDAFERSMSEKTEKHVKLTMSRVRRILDGCQFDTLAMVDEEAVGDFLKQLCGEQGLGRRTYNHYVQAIESFGNWCVQKRRAVTNPVQGLEKVNAAPDVRRKRRALSPAEFSKLVTAARSSSVLIQCYDGETRARIYILSYMTGLRRKEIASLTPRSFRLDADQPTLTVEAACSKHRRKDTLPIHAELVRMLGLWLEGLEDDEPLFPKLEKRRTWLMVKKDLERAGIPYVTAEGVADFHAAGRHTYITQLFRSGAKLTEARELARHSDVNMTMRYTHIDIHDQARALSSLPAPQEVEPDDEKRPNDDREAPGSSEVKVG